MTLNKLGHEINAINQANGWAVVQPTEWAEPYKVPAILALIHSELSEALEAFRADDKANFAKELADVIIRVLDCAVGLDIDMDLEVTENLIKNRGRGYRHGGKRV